MTKLTASFLPKPRPGLPVAPKESSGDSEMVFLQARCPS